MKKLILASVSPRRKELLSSAGFSFLVVPSKFEELDNLSKKEDIAVNNALGKAKDVFGKQDEEVCVVGADTIVLIDNIVLGKPKTKEEAYKMLKLLSNRVHTVITGYAIINKEKTISGYSQTNVLFNNLTKQQILDYIETGSPMDKAGAYGVQDAPELVKKYEGYISTVIGLPIEEIAPIIKEMIK